MTPGEAGSSGAEATDLSDFEKGLSEARLEVVVHPVDSKAAIPTEQAEADNRLTE